MGKELFNIQLKEEKKLKRSKWLPAHWKTYNYLEHYPNYMERLSHFSALSADLYALTMAQALMDHDKHDLQTVFHGYIRKNPFGGEYLLTAGQNIVKEWLDNWSFDEEDMELLRNKKVQDPETGEMKPLFSEEFLTMLENAELELTVEAVPEGEIAFPDQPIYRITGPIWQAMVVEAFILNVTNSQSLFATLASRLRETVDAPIMGFSSESGQASLLELGLRRAQTIGGLEVARAGYIGGFDGTSNVMAEKYYKIPTAGTMAHALIMTYEDELDAFREYAESMPYNGIFLVDTYDTLQGVKNAIQACKEKGVKLKGIRLDSGDLATLSKHARVILDEAGFKEAKIAASNDLEESTIQEIREAGGKIDIWGVGTNFVTSKKQPALGGVYKLGGVYAPEIDGAQVSKWRDQLEKGQMPSDMDQHFRDVIKLSEDQIKITLPGAIDTLRFVFNKGAVNINTPQDAQDGDYIMDVIVNYWKRPQLDDEGRLKEDLVVATKNNPDQTITIPKGMKAYRPMEVMTDGGQIITDPETVHEAKARATKSLSRLNKVHKKIKDAVPYQSFVSKDLLEKRRKEAARRGYKI